MHSAVVPPTFVARGIAPRGARSWGSSLLALPWGAGAGVLLATGIGAWSAEQAMYVDDHGIPREAIPTMWVLTPVVEEVGKGLGVLLILLLARRIGLRGVLFGAMVGALVGVGFAAVEDASAIAADIAANDLGSGIATWSRPLLALAGLLVAIGAHGAINYGNVAGATDQASFFVALGTAFGWIVVSTILAVTLRLVLTRRV